MLPQRARSEGAGSRKRRRSHTKLRVQGKSADFISRQIAAVDGRMVEPDECLGRQADFAAIGYTVTASQGRGGVVLWRTLLSAPSFSRNPSFSRTGEAGLSRSV